MLPYSVRGYASHLITLSWLFLGATASLLSLRNTTQQFTFDEISPTTNLIWYPCLETYQCAMLNVPLDYSQPNGSRAAVPLIKISAEANSPNGTYQGMILVNPGGPGDPGIDFLLASGNSVLVPVIGTNFDIISFDPRGLGRSLPRANCSQSADTNNKVLRRAFGLSGPEEPDAFWEETFAELQAFGAQCATAIGGPDGAGEHMSTPVVATDMLSIVDAFAATPSGTSAAGNSSLLNYWGFSYGTFLGQTFSAMYPDRVGRVAIDGVVDPEDYSSGQVLRNIIYTDAAMASFFTYCHLAGPTLCPFYTGTTISDIATRFENLFTTLNATDAVAQNFNNATVIIEALQIIKGTIRQNVYTPITSFPAMAQQLVAYESVLKNLTIDGINAASELGVTNPDVPGTIPELQEYLPAVLCTDSPSIFNRTYQDLKPSINTLEGESFLGGEIWSGFLVYCTGWSIQAKWRFSGPFSAITKNPILYISNTVDPATPIDNSLKWSPQYIGSQVLTIEAVGHTSIGANNACANSKIGHFFQTGELPGAGTICKAEAGAFGFTIDLSSVSVFTVGGGNNGSSVGNSSTITGIGPTSSAASIDTGSMATIIVSALIWFGGFI